MTTLEKKSLQHVLQIIKGIEVKNLYFAAETASIKVGLSKPDTGYVSKCVLESFSESITPKVNEAKDWIESLLKE